MDGARYGDCSEWVTEELRPEHICTRCKKPRLFVTTQWTESQAWYVAFRCVVAAALVGWVIYDYYMETLVFYAPRYGLWFVFATDWAFLVLVATSIFQAVLIVCYHVVKRQQPSLENERPCCAQPQDGEDIPVKYKALWILYTVTASNAFVVSLSYWTFIIALSHEKVFMTTSTKCKHSINSVLVLVNLLIDGIPIRLLHVLYPFLSGILYVLFTVIYYLCGGRGAGWSPSIYPVLGWQSPGESLVTVGLELLLTVLMHTLAYALYRLRLALQGCCGKGENVGCGCGLSAEERENECQELIDGQGTQTSQRYDSLRLEPNAAAN